MQKFLSKDLFTNMYVFFKSKELVKQVCELLQKFPYEEQCALSD